MVLSDVSVTSCESTCATSRRNKNKILANVGSSTERPETQVAASSVSLISRVSDSERPGLTDLLNRASSIIIAPFAPTLTGPR